MLEQQLQYNIWKSCSSSKEIAGWQVWQRFGVRRGGGKLSSSHCWDALAELNGLSWSLLIPASSCISGRGGSLWNLFVTWASNDHQEWDLCSPLLRAIAWQTLVQICGRTMCGLKWISCWWNAPHGKTAENIFCLCTEQVHDGRSTSCLWAFLGSAWGCVWEETPWAELAEMHHTLKPSRNEVIILQIKINMFILVGKKTLLTEKINFHTSCWISDKYLCY